MKKYDLLSCLLFFFFVVLFSFPSVFAKRPLEGRVIFLDPGHGGVDPGSVVGEIYEKNINLNISKYLKEELIKNGATVYLTRDGDYDLGAPNVNYRKKSDFDNRIKRINGSKANIYLSIHLNVLSDTKYSGPQVFYNNKDEKNKVLAEHIQNYLNKKLNSKREVKKIPSSTYMYSKLSISGVLIECGFLSNYKERSLLTTEEYQKKIAMYISEAIQDYSF